MDGRTLYTINGEAMPPGPVPTLSANRDGYPAVLKELLGISADVRDAIGRLGELETLVKRNSVAVEGIKLGLDDQAVKEMVTKIWKDLC